MFLGTCLYTNCANVYLKNTVVLLNFKKNIGNVTFWYFKFGKPKDNLKRKSSITTEAALT